MAHVLLTCRLPSGTTATVAAAASHLDVPTDAIDPEFGVVLIDPAANSYAVMVEEAYAGGAAEQTGIEGPFANPRIEPFGPDPTAADPAGPDT